MSNEQDPPIFGRRPVPETGEQSNTSEYALPPTAEELANSRRTESIQDFDDTPTYERTFYEESEPEYDPANDHLHAAEQAEPFVPQSARDALEPTPVIPPVRRSSKARGTLVRFFNFLITLAFLGAVGFVGAVWYGKTQFEAKGPLAKAETFVVPKGATFRSIQQGLEEKNIIPRQGVLRVFQRGIQAANKASALKAGEFAFTPGMSMREVMLQLTEGKAIEYALTFPEGWTSHKIMERVAADPTLTGDLPATPPEGSMLPNTYSFQKGMTRTEFVRRMTEAQKKAVREIWATRAEGLPLKSLEEFVILASIIEKETGVSGERAHVASVFVNRLRKGMRLQTDPTVIYGIWGGRGKPKDRGGLRRSELDKKTPYNTYQINGLPPGPISNPGLETLRATANPLQTNDLFFVADGTGGHVFAQTLKEHNANVKKWREIEAQRKKEAEAAAKEAEQGTTTGN